jgi:capsular exopolysaccharide synthesis family protein
MIDDKYEPVLHDELNSMELKHYFIRYMVYWPIILISVLISVMIVFVYHQIVQKQFEVGGSIYINNNVSPQIKIFDRSNIFENGNNLENDILILSSKKMALNALKRLDFEVSFYGKYPLLNEELYKNSPISVAILDNHSNNRSDIFAFELISKKKFKLVKLNSSLYHFISDDFNTQSTQSSSLGVYEFGEEINIGSIRFIIKPIDSLKNGVKIYFKIQHPKHLADYYAKEISIKPLYNFGSVLEVKIKTNVIEKGKDYVNALMEAYIEYDFKEKNKLANNAYEIIEAQIKTLKDSLKTDQNNFSQIKKDNQVFDISSQSYLLLQDLESLKSELREYEEEKGYILNIFDFLKDFPIHQFKKLKSLAVHNKIESLNSAFQHLNDLINEREKLLISLENSHPSVLQLDLLLEEVLDDFKENVTQLSLTSIFRIETIKKEINQKQEEILKYMDFDLEFSNLARDYKLKENFYSYLLEKKSELEIARFSHVSSNSIIDNADYIQQISPNIFKNYSLSITLGAFFPLFFLSINNYFRDLIKDHHALNKNLRIPILGDVASTKGWNWDFDQFKNSFVAESFRTIRSGLFFIKSEKSCKNILVTSAVSGEGKSFISLNLAISMALSGKKTCWVGLDLRKPYLLDQVFYVPKLGLSNYLVENATLDQIVNPSKFENLSFVSSGPVPPNPSELLLKQKLEVFFNDLESSFEVIIIDTPPIGLVSETVDLLRFSDINLFVVRQNFSTKANMKKFEEMFVSRRLNNFYVIFNDVDSTIDSQYFN